MGKYGERVNRFFLKIPRLPEFEDIWFYSTDFTNVHFKFLTVYDKNMNLLSEYAHIIDTGHNSRWVKPDETAITDGGLVVELEENCYKYREIFLDLYVEDIFKPNPRITRKIIFQYKMSFDEKTKIYKRGTVPSRRVHKRMRRYAYSVESIDDVKCFHSIEQVIGNQEY